MSGIEKTHWQVLSPLLDELLDADAAGRARRLAQILQEDGALGTELAALLAQQARVETAHFLEGSALDLSAIASRVEQVVGNYTLERELGQGGMGSVWLARRSDGRYEGRAAVKFLNLGLLGRGGLERFRREGSVLARLAHPHIARLLDAGVLAGQPYLVLEYIEGEPLDRYCDQRRMDIRARVRLFLAVLAAVEHAHNNLILHRDLKPSNILVTPAGDPKLLDFGIAKLIGEPARGADEAAPTQAFTPEYAAPEQVQAGDATTATDVYALGVLLHVLLTGTHPTGRPGGGAAEQMRALIEREPARASETARSASLEVAAARAATPQQLGRALQGDLENILAKALKKAPAERYATAAAFADDLRRYLHDEPVAARPDALSYRMRKFVRRHRLAVGTGAAAVLALVAGVVGTTWQAVEARSAQARAEASAQEALRRRAEAEFEARVARANHEFLSQVFGDAMRGGESARMQQRLDRARELLRRRYASDPEVHSILLMQVAGRYAELNDAKREAEVLDEIEALADKSGKPALQASMQCIRAYDLLVERRLEAAAPFLERGLALARADPATAHFADFECVRADAMMAALRNDPARAQRRMNDYLAGLERDGRQRTRGYLSALGSLAYVQVLAGEIAPAVESTRRKIALDHELGSGETLGSTIDYERLAALLLDLGRVSESAEADAQLLRLFTEEKEAPPSSMRASFARRALMSGDAAAAVALLRDLVPYFEKQGPESYARGALLDLADGYWQLRRPAEAEALLQRFERRLATQAATPQEVIEFTRLRGLLALDRGRRAPAVAEAEALVRALDAAPTSLRKAVLLRARLAAGWILFKAGDAPRAREQAERALALARQNNVADKANAWAGAASLLLAHVHAGNGEATLAAQNLEIARREIDGSVGAAHPLRRVAALPVGARTPKQHQDVARTAASAIDPRAMR